MKLINIKEIKGTITLKSGLHIGSGDMEMKIGGTDNPVIKHPHTHEPFIPGSSIKGKVRSLLEMVSGLMSFTDGHPFEIKHLDKKDLTDDLKKEGEKIIKLFGSGGAANDNNIDMYGPTRASFADSLLDSDWKNKAIQSNWPLTEIKAENTINRISGTANPRFTERVPSGAIFNLNISLKVFDGDEHLEDLLFRGLRLLSDDSLGGSGSRGYGQVQLTFDEDNQKIFDGITVF